jgi:hypothetical protein
MFLEPPFRKGRERAQRRPDREGTLATFRHLPRPEKDADWMRHCRARPANPSFGA